MGEARRRRLTIDGDGSAASGLKGGTPESSAPPASLPIARKLFVGVYIDHARSVLVVVGRGPLDVTDTEVEFPLVQIKHLAGQMMQQEAELVMAQLRAAKPLAHR